MAGESINLSIEKYFSENTLSVHLKENTNAFAKIGLPGNWELKNISKKHLSSEDLENLANEIIEISQNNLNGFIEIKRDNSIIAQIKNYRFVITTPPLSDGIEITAVRPIKSLELSDYDISKNLLERIKTKSEGILISGAPGQGKTTFAQSLAMYYSKKNKIVKTIEAPRDLILPDSITQLALSRGSEHEIRDILLLSRPDYTFFDEMRNTKDFRLFSDLRLSGVGMIGVVHATNPVDAIQRFIGRIELGVIPHIIDTVIYVKNGEINKVFEVTIEIKTPTGMYEKDLARPIVCVKDFETKELSFEIYSFGEDTVIVPVKDMNKKSHNGINKIVEQKICEVLAKYSDNVKAKMIDKNNVKVIVPVKDIAKIVGKDRSNIENIEENLGLKISIESINEKKNKDVKKQKVSYEVELTEKYLHLKTGAEYVGKSIDVYIDDNFTLTAKVSKKGTIKVKKDSDIGKDISNGIKKGKLFLYL